MQQLTNMKLHEHRTFPITDSSGVPIAQVYVTRVPGGWIYELNDDAPGRDPAIFVPERS